MSSPVFGGRHLTTSLRKLAAEIVDVDESGDPLTRAEKLAAMIWKMALGYTEDTRDDHGNLKRIVHPPVQWAIQYVYERMEGKAPLATPDDGNKIRAVDKVSELAKARINDITARVIGPPPPMPEQKKNEPVQHPTPAPGA